MRFIYYLLEALRLIVCTVMALLMGALFLMEQIMDIIVELIDFGIYKTKPTFPIWHSLYLNYSKYAWPVFNFVSKLCCTHKSVSWITIQYNGLRIGTCNNCGRTIERH